MLSNEWKSTRTKVEQLFIVIFVVLFAEGAKRRCQMIVIQIYRGDYFCRVELIIITVIEVTEFIEVLCIADG